MAVVPDAVAGDAGTASLRIRPCSRVACEPWSFYQVTRTNASLAEPSSRSTTRASS